MRVLPEDKAEWEENDIRYALDRCRITGEEAQAMMAERGLDPITGPNAVPNVNTPPAMGQESQVSEGAPADPSIYDEWTKDQLHEELADRGLDYKSSANKAELVALLVANDGEE